MIALAYFLLKVIICSGLLYSYYYLALRNRFFHIWNRFYLLVTIVLSLTLPLIAIQVYHEPEIQQTGVIRMLNVVTAGDQYVHEISSQPTFAFSAEQFIIAVYVLISLFMICVLIKTLLHINRLVRHHPVQAFDDFYFISTEAKGTPFSFLKYIFWNNQIEPDSAAGQQMLKHELVHVREKHTYDKIFINLVLLVFWSNPFFWLIRREMALIHEFIADQKSVEQGDTKAFAAMILQTLYPQHQFSITNNFFYSPIKRRLLMLTKIRNPRTSYIGRLLVLPLFAILIVAFTLKVKQQRPESSSMQAFSEPFTLVVDAGHGGEDNGAIAPDGTSEKDITLSIARKIRELNANPNLEIILIREKDELRNVRDKLDTAISKKPGAFISIHVNAAPLSKSEKGLSDNARNGFEIYLSARNAASGHKSILLGSLLSEEIRKTYTISGEIKKREGKGIWMLDAPAVNYPAVLIECGFMSDKNDVAFIKDHKNQEKIARNILDAVQRFAAAKDHSLSNQGKSNQLNSFSSGTEQVPDTSIEQILIYNKKKAAEYLKIPLNEIKELRFEGGGENIVTIVKLSDLTSREIPYSAAKAAGIQFPPPPPPPKEPDHTIKSIDLTSDGDVIVIYKNEKAAKITKEEAVKRNLLPAARQEKNPANPNVQQKANPVLIEDEVIVEEKIKKEVLKEIKAEEKKYGAQVIYEVEQEPEFPGGKNGLANYVSQRFKSRERELASDKNSRGTCRLQFIVDEEGELSDIKALTLAESKLSQILIDILSNGPKWKPAMQNGHMVKASHTFTFTFVPDEKN